MHDVGQWSILEISQMIYHNCQWSRHLHCIHTSESRIYDYQSFIFLFCHEPAEGNCRTQVRERRVQVTYDHMRRSLVPDAKTFLMLYYFVTTMASVFGVLPVDERMSLAPRTCHWGNLDPHMYYRRAKYMIDCSASLVKPD
jgi:hypothetical protein